MRHRIRIDELIPGESRWVSYNDQQEHQLDPLLLEKAQNEAESNLWSQSLVHGRKLGCMLFDLLNGTGDLLHRIFQQQEDFGNPSPFICNCPKI